MRVFFFTTLIALFVLCTLAPVAARAQESPSGLSPSGLNPSGITDACSQVFLVAPSVRPLAPAHPWQSRAPTMCSDVDQAGCQVQAPTGPQRWGFDPAAGDAGVFTPPFYGLSPSALVALLSVGETLGEPLDGHIRLAWRPPNA